MCISSIPLGLYRSRYYNESNFMLNTVVPCGHCLQCRISAKNDLFLRARSEYLHCLKNNGSVIFLTFTYSDANVPFRRYCLNLDGTVSISDSVCDSSMFREPFTFMSFDKRHIQLYLKRVRKHIYSKYGLVDSLRFICVPEYGSKRTQRPHYHCIFFLNSDLTSSLCSGHRARNDDKFVINEYMSLFRKFWPYGIVSESSKGLFVVDESCIGYVTKYLCKNSDLLQNDRLYNFYCSIDYWFDNFLLKCPDGHDFKTPMSYFLYYCKLFGCSFYCHKSVGFGLHMIDDLPLNDPKVLSYRLHKGIYIVSNGKCRNLRYPRYILNKLFYNFRSDGSYYFSDLGLSCLPFMYEYKLHDCLDSVRRFNWSVLDCTPNYIFDSVYSKYLGCQGSLNSILKHSLFRDFLDKSVYLFAYLFFRRGVFYSDDSQYNLSNLAYDDFVNDRISFCQYVSRMLSIRVPFDIKPLLPSDSLCLSDFIKHYNSVYDKYDNISFATTDDSYFNLLLDMWTVLTSFHRENLLKYYENINFESKQISDIVNSIKYYR